MLVVWLPLCTVNPLMLAIQIICASSALLWGIHSPAGEHIDRNMLASAGMYVHQPARI